jgi:hypothetical protein
MRLVPCSLDTRIIALYMHGAAGQANGAWEEENPFWFRDCGFLSNPSCAAWYKSIMASFGQSRAGFAVPLS